MLRALMIAAFPLPIATEFLRRSDRDPKSDKRLR